MRISDWSSDVCSSDLDVFAVDLVNVAALAGQAHLIVFSQNWHGLKGHQCGKRGQQGLLHDHRLLGLEARQAAFHEVELGLMGQWPVENTILGLVGNQIGDTACRGRVCTDVWMSGGAYSLPKKTNKRQK